MRRGWASVVHSVKRGVFVIGRVRRGGASVIGRVQREGPLPSFQLGRLNQPGECFGFC